MVKVLIIDDEPRIVQGVRRYFESAGFETWAAADGRTGVQMARRESPDLIILDLRLPEMDGLDVCRILRRESDVPIIILTARADETDKLIGLELGADDYVTKPFSPRELVARARAVLRRTCRSVGVEPQRYIFGDVVFDVSARQCLMNGTPVPLTPTEFELLHTLLRHRGHVLSRAQLLDAVNLGLHDGVARTVDVHIHNLRHKIEPDPARPRYILTVFGVGYRFSRGAQA